MKKIVYLIITLVLQMFSCQMYAQCTPDPNCVDDSIPGQICPAVLPDGTINVPYSQVMTVIPPSSATIPIVGTVTISKIVLTSILNLPPGITYVTNSTSNTFMVGTKYCILLSGTPTDTGTYQLNITCEAYFTYLGLPVHQPYSDSTSYSIRIKPVGGSVISVLNPYHFRMLDFPNPFNSCSRLGVYSPSQQSLTLSVYNCLGQKVYEENRGPVSGDVYFSFDGTGLTNGMYIYSISNPSGNYNGRLFIANP